MGRARSEVDEHGIFRRCNAKESAGNKISAKDIDLERLPPIRGLRFRYGDELRHEACVVYKHIDVANRLKRCVDGLLIRAVGDKGEDFGLWEGGLDCFLGSQESLLRSP